jgi:2-polyprenyl-3-methyl-5-hydroxy-6-metoxy-1,4-benzoquinol methylase
VDITMDPENRESEALFRLSGGFADASVLEIGCGDGRLTWQIAPQARRVVGIDPKEERIARARQDTPSNLESRVLFTAQSLEDYAASIPSSERFDRALLSWSL